MKITIMGAAGTLGSCAAFTIAIHKLANEIVLIDPGADMLKAHWMDLNTVAAAQDVLVNRGTFADMAGSDIVVITSGAPSGVTASRADLITGNLPIIIENAENIKKYCPKAIVITETNPVDPLNYAVYLVNGKENRQKYIGYTLNDTIRFRMWTAAALGIRSSRVRGLVMGEHGHSQVMLWSSLKVDGRPVQVNEEDKAKIQTLPPQTLHDYETLKPKRTAGWTSAVGTATIINAITNNTQELIPCSAILDGEYGCRNMSMSVPAIIGRDGVHYIRIVDMNEQEQAGLQKSIDFLTSMMRHVEQYPGIK